MGWFPQFLLLHALGCLAAAQLAPASQIGQYFHRFMAWVGLIMSATALGVQRSPDPVLIGAVAASIAAWVAGRVAEGGGAHRALRALVVLGLAALAGTVAVRLASRPLVLVQGLASGAFLGATLTAMITGHFYLNNANLPFEILVRMCRAVVASGGMVVAISGILFATGSHPIATLEDWVQRGRVLEALLPVVRFLAGGVFALVLAWMALSCARIRSNQSATGILYALVGVVLIGEMSSHYMTHGLGFAV